MRDGDCFYHSFQTESRAWDGGLMQGVEGGERERAHLVSNCIENSNNTW